MDRKRHRYREGELVIVIDCADLDRAAEFWSAVLGYQPETPGTSGGSGGSASGRYLGLHPADGDGIEILLQRVPDGKRQKNRVHLDLRTRDLDAEVRRVVGLGATRLTSEPIAEVGWRWHILADPDGNEFCVLRPPPEAG